MINCLIMQKIAKIQYAFFFSRLHTVILIVNDLDYRTLSLFSMGNLREDELKDVLVNHHCRCSPLEEKLTYYQMNIRYHYEQWCEKEKNITKKKKRIQSYSTSMLLYLFNSEMKYIKAKVDL